MGKSKLKVKKRNDLPSEQKIQDILAAAKKVFSEKGYHKSTIGEIAAQAGVAHGTIYNYFPSKSALATEIIGTWGASGFIETLREKNGKDDSPKKFLTTIAKKFYGRLDERLPLIRFRISEGVVNSELGSQYYEKLLHRFIKHVADFCTQCQEKGIFKKGDPYIQGHIFYGLLFSFMYTQELMQGKKITGIELNKIIDTVIDTYLHGVAASHGS